MSKIQELGGPRSLRGLKEYFLTSFCFWRLLTPLCLILSWPFPLSVYLCVSLSILYNNTSHWLFSACSQSCMIAPGELSINYTPEDPLLRLNLQTWTYLFKDQNSTHGDVQHIRIQLVHETQQFYR